VFDHEGDWEHVSVRLGADLRPQGAWYARHHDSHPGAWFDWAALSREGDHPVVLSARGTHASYAATIEVPDWERTCDTTWPAAAAAGGCRVWRTWAEDTGGVVNVGERAHPRVPFIAWPRRPAPRARVPGRLVQRGGARRLPARRGADDDGGKALTSSALGRRTSQGPPPSR